MLLWISILSSNILHSQIYITNGTVLSGQENITYNNKDSIKIVPKEKNIIYVSSEVTLYGFNQFSNDEIHILESTKNTEFKKRKHLTKAEKKRFSKKNVTSEKSIPKKENKCVYTQDTNEKFNMNYGVKNALAVFSGSSFKNLVSFFNESNHHFIIFYYFSKEITNYIQQFSNFWFLNSFKTRPPPFRNAA